MKIRAIVFVAVAGIALAACGSDDAETASGERPAATDQPATDATSAASIVSTAKGVLAAAGEDGTWIIAITEDVTVDEEVILDGEFTRRDEIARKLALYAQDDERNITDRYTLTAPRLVVRSPNARIQGGTFIGDVRVEADGFLIVDATVDGSVTFASEEYRESAEMDEGSVTGEITVE